MVTITRRPTLIPRWVAPAIGIVLLLIVSGGTMFLQAERDTSVTVPSVRGLEAPVGRSRLAQAGLLMECSDTRFSSEVPAGGILEQHPLPGTEVDPRTHVTVVVSAGSDRFDMPDLVGMDLLRARAELDARGVTVEITTAPSDAAPGTVIATMPSPGVEIATGSIVRITVAGDVGADVLLPGDLDGLVILLDPAPPQDDTSDVAMEITRHLQSLLAASGAEVLVTRSIVETQASDAVRAAWARETSPTVSLGLATGTGTRGVRDVLSLPSGPDHVDVYLASVDLGRSVVSYLVDTDEQASLGLPVEDAVLLAARSPGVRILLGDAHDPQNVEDFSDPAWIDRFSQALYRAIVAFITDP